MTIKKYLVSWVGSADLGVYEGANQGEAILAAVQDAGYVDLGAAAEFILSDNGELMLQAAAVKPDLYTDSIIP